MSTMNQKPTAWWMKASEPETADYLTFNTPTRDQKISHRAIPYKVGTHIEQQEWLRTVRKTEY